MSKEKDNNAEFPRTFIDYDKVDLDRNETGFGWAEETLWKRKLKLKDTSKSTHPWLALTIAKPGEYMWSSS